MNDGKRFWMVYCDGGHGPVQKHRTTTDAFREAQRVCAKTCRPSFVLEVVGGFEIPKPEPVCFTIP